MSIANRSWTKEAKETQWKKTKTVFATNGAGTQDVNVPKMNPDTSLKPFTKFISKWIFDLNVKYQKLWEATPGRKEPKWPWAGDTRFRYNSTGQP